MVDEGVQIILDAIRQRGVDGDYRDLGMIRTQRSDNLLIFNYTQQAQYSRTWGAVERAARGLIVDAVKGEIVALPWSKFFNLNETPETSLDQLVGKHFEATVKVDGSLGIIYYGSDGWAVATRGSFEGDQARWATAFFRKHHAARFDEIEFPRHGLTLLVEIIYPENRVVLDYGRDERLVLIGARWFEPSTGELKGDYDRSALGWLGADVGMPVVEPAGNVLHDLLVHQQRARGVEGWVLRFDDGLRVKVKTEHYLSLHRAVFGLTPERIREAMVEGRINELIAALPEELQPGAQATAWDIGRAASSEEVRIHQIYSDVRGTLGDVPRGDFARHVVATYPEDKTLLFSLLDGRDIYVPIVKRLDLSVVLGEVTNDPA